MEYNGVDITIIITFSIIGIFMGYSVRHYMNGFQNNTIEIMESESTHHSP